MVERLVDSIGHGADSLAPSDVDPPFLTNQVPAPLDTMVSTTANILLRIDDLGDGVNLSSVLIEIDEGSGFNPAYDGGGGGFQSPYNGGGSSVVAGGTAGFDFVIDPTSSLTEFQTITVRVTASDLSILANTLGPVSYIFDTADETVPIVTSRVPAPGVLSVDITTNISFTLADPAPGSGIDSTTINLTINDGSGITQVILNGVIQAGYSGSITPNGTGFDVLINPDVDLTDDVTHNLQLDVDDLEGNSLSTGWSWSTADPPPPEPPPPILAGLPGFPLDMYRFLIAPIPEADHKDGNLFLKRYLDGPNKAWQEVVRGLQEIPNLWSVSDIKDEHLQFLKNILGWTEELEGITDRIDNAALRRLIAASGALWRERGPEQAIIDVLSIVTGGVRMRIWNWFDFRWVLDETELGEEHEGNDPWVIDFPSESRVPQFSTVIPETNAEYFSNLRIVDNGTLDRILVKDVLNLMRAVNERFEITYVDFLDLFQVPGDNLQWSGVETVQDSGTTNAVITGGNTVTLPGGSAADEFGNVGLNDIFRNTGNGEEAKIINIVGLPTVIITTGGLTNLAGQSWEVIREEDYAVEDGVVKLEDDTKLEETHAIVTTSSDWDEYVYSARIRGNSTASANFGLTFYFTDFDNNYLVAIDTTTQTLTLQKRVAGTPTILDTVDLGTAEINLLPDVWYTVRAEIVVEGPTNRILVFVDGSQLINTTDPDHTQGSVGIFHEPFATIQCDEAEVMELPVDSETLEINP